MSISSLLSARIRSQANLLRRPGAGPGDPEADQYVTSIPRSLFLLSSQPVSLWSTNDIRRCARGGRPVLLIAIVRSHGREPHHVLPLDPEDRRHHLHVHHRRPRHPRHHSLPDRREFSLFFESPCYPPHTLEWARRRSWPAGWRFSSITHRR